MHLSLLPGQGGARAGGQRGQGGARGGQGGARGGGGGQLGPPKLLSGALPPWTPPGGVWVPGICRQWALGPGGGRGGARGCQRKCPPEALVVGFRRHPGGPMA